MSGSLFDEASARGLIARRTASRKGDVLTILVREVSKGQLNASTTTSRTEAASVGAVSIPILDVFAGPVLGSVMGGISRAAKSILKGATTGGKASDAGSGITIRNSDYSTTMSVLVTDVDANGNLHIEGSRFVQINKELQKMTLTGIVRPDDVTIDNTVASSRIANADIKADGTGAVADKTRRSLLGKILDWLL